MVSYLKKISFKLPKYIFYFLKIYNQYVLYFVTYLKYNKEQFKLKPISYWLLVVLYKYFYNKQIIYCLIMYFFSQLFERIQRTQFFLFYLVNQKFIDFIKSNQQYKSIVNTKIIYHQYKYITNIYIYIWNGRLSFKFIQRYYFYLYRGLSTNKCNKIQHSIYNAFEQIYKHIYIQVKTKHLGAYMELFLGWVPIWSC
eukprot:TRINITY_DN750_c1_g1_i1.p1 TRINITY_DN750_c1_g1~~TRINITY_DN750_c1_g1_i1.p1  ORF type:complete len:197 (-),score=-30.20 TRINITY_DN750_c1_g1_i1:64-654(-)